MKTPEEMAEEYCENHDECEFARDAFLAGYQAAQTNLSTPAKWISVKERLPEIPDGHLISKEVLWISCYGEIEVSFLEKLRSELRIDWGEAGLYKLDQVTHWMPLPEPPKKEE